MFIPSKKEATDFNDGNEFVNYSDSLNADDLNNLVESALYSQNVADNAYKTATGSDSKAQNAVNIAHNAEQIATGIDSKTQTQLNEHKQAIENNSNAIQANASAISNNATAIGDNTKAIQDKASQVDLTTEIKARELGDTNALKSAKSYTDTQITNETSARESGDVNTLASANKNAEGLISGLEQTFNTTLNQYGVSLDIVEDASVFKFNFQLKNAKSEVLSSKEIDLPLESVVVNGRYDIASQSIILTLQNSNEVTIPVGDIISGLVSQDTFDKAIQELNANITNILASAKLYTDGEVKKVSNEITKTNGKVDANITSISQINKELSNKADSTRVDNLEIKVNNVVAPIVPENTQNNEIFIKDTPSNKTFIHTLGNTEQNTSSPNLLKTSKENESKYLDENGLPIQGRKDGSAFCNVLLEPNTNYAIYIDAPTIYECLIFYFKDDNSLIGVVPHNEPINPIRFAMPSIAKYINFAISIDGELTVENNFYNIMLVKDIYADTTPPYQPYAGQPSPNNPIEVKSVVSPINVESSNSDKTISSTISYSITDINGTIHEMNGIDGVYDSIIQRNNKWYLEKKFAKQILNGTETWTPIILNDSYKLVSPNSIIKKAKLIQGDDAIAKMRNNMSISTSISKINNSINGSYINGNDFVIYTDIYNTHDVSLWKQHLAQTPMEVVYELATPEYYELDQAEVLKMYATTYNGGTNFAISSESATPIMDFKATLLQGEHADVVLLDKEGNIIDPHTGSGNVWIGDKQMSLKEWVASIETRLQKLGG